MLCRLYNLMNWRCVTHLDQAGKLTSLVCIYLIGYTIHSNNVVYMNLVIILLSNYLSHCASILVLQGQNYVYVLATD